MFMAIAEIISMKGSIKAVSATMFPSLLNAVLRWVLVLFMMVVLANGRVPFGVYQLV